MATKKLEDMSKAELVAAMKAKATKNVKLSMKVSEKSGCLSVYGLQRYPVSLYREQWGRLLAIKPEIEQFIADHSDELTKKGERIEV